MVRVRRSGVPVGARAHFRGFVPVRRATGHEVITFDLPAHGVDTLVYLTAYLPASSESMVDVSEGRFGSVRRAYVRCEDDRTVTPEQQRRAVDERDCDAELTLEAGHSPFLAIPAQTADTLEAAAER